MSVTSGYYEAATRIIRRMAFEVAPPPAEEKIADIDGPPWIRNQIGVHGLVDPIGLASAQESVEQVRRTAFVSRPCKWTGWEPRPTSGIAEWRRGLGGKRRQEADRLPAYVSQRKLMIRCPRFRDHGWQVGSGATEAERKTTTDRLP